MDHSQEIKDKFPQNSFKERMIKLKELWKNLSDKEKYFYVKRSKVEKAKYMKLSYLKFN